MGDELANFFAKKASKAKKKGVIRLEDVAEKLERRARIQVFVIKCFRKILFKDELDEVESKIESEPSTTKLFNNVIDNEDSEWLDFNDKPVLPPAIKEMADFDIELEEEETRSIAETVKTWNMNNENIEVPHAPIVPQKVKYEPKAVSRAKQNPLDLKNEMAFPSLGDAADVEKKLKEEEEKNILREIEEKKTREEKERQQKQRYEAPRPETRNTKFAKPTNVSTESKDPDNWRNAPTPIPEPPKTINTMRQPDVKKNAPESDVSDNWRKGSEKTPESMPIPQKPSLYRPPVSEQTSDSTPIPQKSSKYVPPWLRKQQQ